MHQGDGRGDVGQINGFLDSSIAAADNRHGLLLVEESVTGRAGGDALALESLLGRQAQVLRGRSGGNNQGVAGVCALVPGQDEGPLGQGGGMDMIEDDLGAEALGVAKHSIHERRSLKPFHVPGPVVDVGGSH